MTPRHALRRGCVYLTVSQSLGLNAGEAIWVGDRFLAPVCRGGAWQLEEAAHVDDGGDVTPYQQVDVADDRIPLTACGLEGVASPNRALLRLLLRDRDAVDFWRGPQALPEGNDADFDDYEHLLRENDYDGFVAFSGRPC